MKSTLFTLTLLSLGNSRANVTESEAQLLCGNLGVMKVPDGVDPKSVRTCREHPSIRDIQDVMRLEKRKCWYGRDAACSKKGRCFRTCDNGGTGAWCWTTVGGPLSDWNRCVRDRDCGRNDTCGGGGCKKCGCGC
ncbi:hypothetical protein BM221_005706 [Beauveria bassiana]|uniref:IDI-2 n=1 Tax=Beauveria bassiana TaxID=176275 RepID=A0A2N6NPD0_BEABA|nr:hypothetical protein BM221_005706 [Beauveria bassiana]